MVMAKENPTAIPGGGAGRGYVYRGPVKGPTPKLKPKPATGTPSKPKPKTPSKPTVKPTPVATPKRSNVGGRAGEPAKITNKTDIVKSTYRLWKNPPQPMPKPKPPISNKVIVTKTAPKPKPKPNSVPSGRPAKPTVTNNKPVKLSAPTVLTKKQAEVAKLNEIQKRERLLKEQELRNSAGRISHKPESTQSGSNVSNQRTPKQFWYIN